VVVALALLVVGPMAGDWLGNRLGFGATFGLVWAIARWIGAGLLVMVVWAALYKFLPDTDAPFRVFTPGTVIGVVLWLIASYGFGLYLGHFNNYETTYGTLGGAIIFLTWLWMSNLALFVGAEVDHVLSELRGREKRTTDHPADIHHSVPNSAHVVGSPQHSL
jgi:membrane protein